MARIAGVNLPREKRVEIGLTYIFGIGRSTSQSVLSSLEIDRDTKVRDLTEEEVSKLRGYIDQNLMVEGDLPFLNLYSVMEVNPGNGPKVNTSGGKAFADFMLSADIQKVIKTFGVDKYGQALFVPVAGMSEEQVGS